VKSTRPRRCWARARASTLNSEPHNVNEKGMGSPNQGLSAIGIYAAVAHVYR
jgi:hypothetical protein